MGPTLPPQRKGRLPQYARNKLEELQDKFDELEKAGVFVKPEDHNIVAEYLNPSFLIKKSSGVLVSLQPLPKLDVMQSLNRHSCPMSILPYAK